MKTLASVSAAALLAAGAAGAQQAGDPSQYLRAGDIIDNPVYTTAAEVESDWDLDAEIADIDAEYDRIGEIDDILMNGDGEIVGIVAEIGGFLDLADKHVMLPVADLQVVQSGGEPYYVTRMTEEPLEEMQGLEEGWWS